MRPWIRWSILAATVVGLVVLFVALRPAGETVDRGSPTPTPSPTGSPSETPSETPSESPTPQVRVIEVTYRDGEVQGPTRFTVLEGERVRILVRADVSDHVHLHGYDIMADVAPGSPGRIDLVANVPGIFDVELEDAGRLLFNLEVAVP